jgi:hypothetical protein
MKIVLGSGLALTEVRYLKSATGVFQTIAVFEGTEEAIKALIPGVLADQSYDVDTSEKPKWKITISTPDFSDTETTDTAIYSHELIPNTLQRDLFRAPKASRLHEGNT